MPKKLKVNSRICLNMSRFSYFAYFTLPCIDSKTLGDCVSGIYNWGLYTVGIVAFVQIFFAGVIYLTAAGNTGKISQAKDKIRKAILGLVLLFSSYLILYTINPDLVGGTFTLPKFTETTNKVNYQGQGVEEEQPNSGNEGSGGGNNNEGANPSVEPSVKPTKTPPLDNFQKATSVDFIKSISVLPSQGSGVNEYSVDAKRLLGLNIRLDPSKFIVLEKQLKPQEGQGTYLTLDIKINTSSPVEFMNLENSGLIGYPDEWKKFLGKSSGEIKRGTDFIIEALRFSGNLPGTKIDLKPTSKNFEFVKPRENIFIPDSELGRKIELTVSILAQDENKKLIKDEKKITLNVARVNRSPIATSSRNCATTVKEGKQECFDGLVEGMAAGSAIQVYLADNKGKPFVSDPDGDEIKCMVLARNGLEGKSFTKEQAPQPEGCSNPGKLWLRFATVPETGFFDFQYILTDGTLLSDVGHFGGIAVREPGKIYNFDSCNPNTDGIKIETYISGQKGEFSCVKVNNGSWSWRNSFYLGGGFDVAGCSVNLGQNGIVEYSPASGKGTWKCIQTTGGSLYAWDLKQISTPSPTGNPAVSPGSQTCPYNANSLCNFNSSDTYQTTTCGSVAYYCINLNNEGWKYYTTQTIPACDLSRQCQVAKYPAAYKFENAKCYNGQWTFISQLPKSACQ